MDVEKKFKDVHEKLHTLTTQNVQILSFLKLFNISAISIKEDATYISEELNKLKQKHTENVDTIIQTMLKLSEKADKISGGLENFESMFVQIP